MAAEYFNKLASGQPDYGYSLIHPANQATWQSHDEYARAVSGIDWNWFSVSVAGTRYCDDGLCFVCVNVPGGLESVPSFLRASANRGNDGVIVHELGLGDCGNGEVSVDLAQGPGEGSGIKISRHP